MSSMDNARPRASKLAERRRDDRSRCSQVIRQLMLLVGAGLVVAASAEPAAAADWSVQPVPLPPRPANTSLSGVSCTSTSDCVAVGVANVISTDNYIPLIEHWNGTKWSIERSPVPPLSDGGGALRDVSCASSNACVAVGSFGPTYAPLAERWNGSSWALQRPPAPVDAYEFDGVSCVSSTECVAVGSGDEPIAERWDGQRWSVQVTHLPETQATVGGLLGVSCPSHATCAAVGANDIGLCSDPYEYGSGYSDYYVPVLGLWASGHWSLRQRPNIACSMTGQVEGGNGLDAVSCTSPTACTAVGSQVYRWNGSRWSVQPTPGSNRLAGVSCTSNNACTAVGSALHTWNGDGWSVLPIPSPARATDVTLSGVSCVSPDSCVAVGSYENQATQDFPLIVSIGMGAITPSER